MAKASGLLALFLIAYYILLRKETFFTSNRGFLLGGLITSALLPLIEYTKVIWVTPISQAVAQEAATNASDMMALQQFIMQQQLTAKPDTFTINWWYVTCCIYAIGVLFFLTRLVVDFIAIRAILKGNSIDKEGSYRLIDSKKVKSPFSFFNYIVYNSTVLQPEELESIIAHEKVHSRQKHSADMIISQLFCIAFWFNPFVWLYKKSISQNLEFIADAVAIKQLTDRMAYQKTLLKITLQPECIAITNHFYQSLIKKRIVMLNKKQSKQRNSWKYAIMLPALTAFMLAFQVKVVAQENPITETTVSDEKFKMSIEINKDATDKELTDEGDIFKRDFDADVTFSEVKRNAVGEITGIKVNVKDKTQSRDYAIFGNNPIRTFTIEMEKTSGGDENTIAFGNPGKNDSISANSINYASTTTNKTNTDNVTSGNIVNNQKNVIIVNPYKGALIIVDGKKQKKGTDVTKLELPSGKAIATVNTYTPREAKEKYGREARKGAVEITTAKKPQVAFTYAYNQNGNVIEPMPPLPPMPPMPSHDEVMAFAAVGVQEGMKALAEIDWKKELIFEGLTDADKEEIKAEMKKAQAEVKRAFKDVELNKAFEKRAEADANRKNKIKDFSVSEEDKKELKKELEEVKKARVELEKARKELEKARADLKKEKH